VFGPNNCLLIIDPQACQPCQIQVPDVSQPLEALAYRNRYYSVFKQDTDAAKLLEIAAKLARRGDDTLITITGGVYRLGLLEPNGRII
jgi:hypothetical protein